MTPDEPELLVRGEIQDSDHESDSGIQHPNGLQERRRRQKLLLDKWLSGEGLSAIRMQKAEDLTTDDQLADEELSIQTLLAGQCGEIKHPRQYQLELFERAKSENTIAVLDTGSGKTLIAVLLLRWILDQELDHRGAGAAPKVALFVVASITLVYQQFTVLEHNLDHRIARISGRSNTASWTPKQWSNFFQDHDVVVCTADLLLHSLGRSYIAMKRINLLIFDEAHHAKKGHAFAQIIKNFYLKEEEAYRPRVFGMTASPIDAKSDVNQAALELETLLHCKIATATDMSFRSLFKRPEEKILQYNPLPRKPFDTPLVESMLNRFPNDHGFNKQIEKCRHLARQLGPWCANEYFITALAEHRIHKYQRTTEAQHFDATGDDKDQSTAELDAQISQLTDIVQFVKERHQQHAELVHEDLSSKVTKLAAYLNEVFERPSSHRCIVFVERRPTARLLAEVMQRIGTEHIKCGYITGGSADADEDNVSFRQQILTLTRFRRGEINCLFATSVAEEGLDIPDCNLVIRFDMYRTMIQYVQSRGRARRQNSTFIHMLERHNSIESNLIWEVREQEQDMRNFCMQLPVDRRLVGNEDMLESVLAGEMNLPTMRIEKTGATLTYANALIYLAEFVSAIPTDSAEPMHPTYSVSSRGQQHVAEVVLPANSPIASAQGQVHARKAMAKRSAAFYACRELRLKEYLDEHFKPVYQKKYPLMRNALLAANMDKSSTYTMRTKPSIWSSLQGTTPEKLWITIIDFPEKLEKPHQPLLLLSRGPLPPFPKFPIFLNDGRRSFVDAKALGSHVVVDSDRLQQFTRFTLAVFKDVFSKVYENDPAVFSYWLAPGKSHSSNHPALLKLDNENLSGTEHLLLLDDPDSLFDWHLLDTVTKHDQIKWTPEMPISSLLNRFIVDPWDGGRKFYSTGISRSLVASDPVPEGVLKRKRDNATILDNTVSLWGKSRTKVEWRQDQPVLEAERLLFRRNTLARAQPKEVNVNTRSLICPEPLRISSIPPEIAECCFFWPGIIHRLESYMIAQEACDLVGVKCGPELALAAVTKDSDNSSEGEDAERINFQAGMGENYERLEFIGDTFLKTATTIATFIQNPNDSEFEFHVKRMLMLCNKNLFDVASDLKLHEYIRSMSFSRRLWYPEGLKLLEGKGAGNVQTQKVEMRHTLSQKTIADVCEALIGAAFISHDRPGSKWRDSHWQNAIHAVTQLVGSEDHTMKMMEDYRTAYALPTYQTGEVSASQRDMAAKVESEHPYHFTYPRLLRSAFIHPSQPYLVERLPNYQRLEFLGDALLDMASITWLFHRFPTKDPQWLTEHKMAMVSNKFLGALCVEMGFHRHIRHNSSILQHQIHDYVTELMEGKRVAGDSRDYWTTVSDPPKCLPDVVESFVGAMFIDSNLDYNAVQGFFDMHVKWYFEDMSIYDTFANSHPCTHMYNALSAGYGCIDYRLMSRELPTAIESEKKDVVSVVMIHDEIIAYSKGKSARYTRVKVAKKTLDLLDGLTPTDFRRRFGCNCRMMEKEAETEEGSAADLGVDCGT